MAFNEEQTREALRYLDVAINGVNQENENKGIKDYPYHAYRSKRPFWVGFYQTLEKEGVSVYPDEVCRDAEVILTREPIPFSLQQQLEILPVNQTSKLALCAEVFSGNALVFYNPGMSAAKVMWRVGDRLESYNINNAGIYYTASDLRGFNDAPDWMVHNAITEGFTKNAVINHRLSKFVGNDIANAIVFTTLLNRVGYSANDSDVKSLFKGFDTEINSFLDEQFKRSPEYAETLTDSWKNMKFLNVFDRKTFDFPYALMNQFGEHLSAIVADKKKEVVQQQEKIINPSSSELIRWIDLDDINIYLGEQRFSDGVSRLMLVDINNYAVEQGRFDELSAIGFKKIPAQLRHDGGIYYFANKEQVLKPAALAHALGLSKIPMKNILRDEVPRLFKEKIFERFEININRYTLDSLSLGKNHNGSTVFDSPYGRFYRDSKSSVVVENGSNLNERKSDFLRVGSQQDLSDCSMAFVMRVAAGQRASYKDFEKFAKTIFLARTTFDSDEPSASQLHQLQEGVEAAAYRYYSERAAGLSDVDAFNLGQNIYFGLPVARQRTAESVALQQFSTPLPMSQICQQLLLGNDVIKPGATVLEPTGGNGGLLTRLPSVMKKQIVELDDKRVAALRQAFPDAEIMHEDATRLNFNRVFKNTEGVDYVIGNPPFGQMPQPEKFDLLNNVRRLDYFIALRALASRKDQGRAVIIVGADGAQSDGTVKGSAKSALTYINDMYEVLGATEVDGRLYARAGSAYNVRIYVIGNKRAIPVQAPVIEKFPVIDTYQALWDWSQSIIASYDNNVEIPDDALLASSAPDASLDVDVLAAAEVSETDRGAHPTAKPRRTRQAKTVSAREPEAPDNIPPPAIKATASEKPVVRNVNEYQAPYQSASKVGQPSTMIPINMSAATYQALSRIQQRYGDIDDYVAQRLHYSAEELPNYFSPEQVDALALAISRVEEGLGMINADQTGIGKGRFVAGLLRYAKLNNKTPVFMSIKPELFTDIFRDISDINSQHLFKKPFIFNTGVDVKVYGTADKVLYPSTPASDMEQAFKTGLLPDGTDLVMTTYSQFARARSTNKKSNLILDIINENTMLFLDESHVAAGESQTSEIISDCVGKSGGVVYSSATPIKGVKNFRLYSKCFPPSVDTVNLADVLAVGGEDLQEAISTNMALDGAIIRREHDFSKLTFATRMPSDIVTSENRDKMNKVAEIIADMSYLSGDVDKIVNSLNDDEKEDWESIPESQRTGNRMNASSMNFSSRLYNITRQFLLAVKTAEAIQASLEAIQSGQKPVIAVENTGESLLRAMIAIRAGSESLEEELDELESKGSLTATEEHRRSEIVAEIAAATANVTFDEPPSFNDLMEVMLDRIAKITVRGRYGDVTTERADSDPEYFEKQETVREKIRAFPYVLPLTPIDEIKHTMASHGYSFMEVSGRTVSIHPTTTDGITRWGVSFHKKADAVSAVAGFQNGKYDGAIITRSGSTGISLHATNRFADSDARQRNFIALQKAANIAEFLQWMGRVNRKDQVIHPIMTNVESGLPAESRQTMMHNTKLRKLSANTTSNRENENLEGDEDLLNNVGDGVALAYLRENPDIADALDIKVPKKGDELSHMSENPYINKLMGRLMMIPVEQQEKILRDIGNRFNEKIELMEQEGKNPFKIDVHDWKASITHTEELVSGNIQASDSSFDEPVKLVKVEYTKYIEPIRFSYLDSLMERNVKAIFSDEKGVVDMPGRLSKLKDVLSMIQKKYVYEHLPARVLKKSPSITDIRNMEKGVDGAKSALEKSDYLLRVVTSLKIGKHVKLLDRDTDEEVYGVIAEIRFPNNDDGLFTLSKYRVKLALAGNEELVEKSLAALRGMEADFSTHLPDFVPGQKIEDYSSIVREKMRRRIQEFDSAPKGEVTIVRNLLEGNIYKACEMAATANVGYPILYTDSEGNRKRAVNIKAAITADEIRMMPLSFNCKDALQYIREHRSDLNRPGLSKTIELLSGNRNEDEKEERLKIIIKNNADFALVTMKGTKQANNGLIINGDIFDLGANTSAGSLKISLSGTRNVMSASVSLDNLDEFMERLVSGGHVGKFYISNYNPDIIRDLKEKNQMIRDYQHSNGDIEMKMTG